MEKAGDASHFTFWIVSGHGSYKLRAKVIVKTLFTTPGLAWKARSCMVLPFVRNGGLRGTLPELLFEKKHLIPAIQQLLVCRGQ